MFIAFLQLLSYLLAYLLPVQQHEYVYKKVGNTKIDVIVYQPTYNTSAINGLKSPVLLMIHGGAFILGEKDNGHDALSPREIKELSSRGWTIVSINYRLAPPAFISDIVEDMQSAYSWIKHKLPKKNPSPIDKNLIVVLGRSAGGGLALTLSLCQTFSENDYFCLNFQRKKLINRDQDSHFIRLFNLALFYKNYRNLSCSQSLGRPAWKELISGYKLDPRPTAIISFFPYCSNFLDGYAYDSTLPPSNHLIKQIKNLKKNAIEAENIKTEPRRQLAKQIFKEQKGGWLLVSHDPREDPNTIRQKLKEFSAVENIDQNYPPTYLSHAINDPVVPYNQSVQMAERLEQHGREVILDLADQGQGHTFDLDASEIIWKEHVVAAFDWADEQLGKAAKAKHKKD